MANSSNVNKAFLRSMRSGDIIPYVGLTENARKVLHTLCSQLKEEGFRFEVRHNPDCNVTVVRRKSHDRV